MGMSPELESKSHARVDSSDCIEKMDDRFYGLRRIIRKWGADFRIWPFDCTESSRNHWPGTPRPMTHSLEQLRTETTANGTQAWDAMRGNFKDRRRTRAITTHRCQIFR
jgi:hypothetical protein